MIPKPTVRLVALPLAAAALLAGCGTSDKPAPSRQATVRALGQQVMPFRLDRTTHIFDKTANGGMESVVAKTAADGAQVPLIREHLRREQRLFAHGNFQDPMAVHGMAMPGIDALRHNPAQIKITYQALANGAQLRYVTTDPHLQSALHEWFDAQLMDHGSDASL